LPNCEAKSSVLCADAADPKSVKNLKIASESYRITPSGQEHLDKVAVANRSANLL
jgi:hypothetical protein